MKRIKSLVAVLLVAILLVGAMPLPARATTEKLPTKEEVVYINLNADGSVKEINVVNIFGLDADGKIVDYGEYESVRNMTTTDEVQYADGTVTVDAKAGKLYYEGKLRSKVMPWNVVIKYYMDDVEYSAKEIAGKSGNLKITISITENNECIGDFFEGHALQANVTLDTKKCQDIVAEGATFANVGSNKQLTYTIMGNKGAELEITAKVRDFEMKAIAINGVKLNFSIDGAKELAAGAKELYNGTSLLESKVGELDTGVAALNTGTETLSGGLDTIASKNKALLDGAYLAFKGVCTAAETALNGELTKSGLSAVTLTPENYSKVLTDLLKKMDADTVYNTAYKEAKAKVTAEVEAKADSIYVTYIEQNANAIYLSVIESKTGNLYAQVAKQVVLEKLIGLGFSEQWAKNYLQTADGQALIEDAVATMTDAQKKQIEEAAISRLTNEEKTQIREGALASLTDGQKKQIRDGAIEQVMKSKEVTDQITAVVRKASGAAASVADLKGQLDSYDMFYKGLMSYTAAVSEAADGANTLKTHMGTLYENVGALNFAVGELNDGMKILYDSTGKIGNGAGTVSGGDMNVSLENVPENMTENASFVSEKNINVQAVQFVIQTEAIEKAAVVEEAPVVAEKLTFWQKLLRLFGLY